MSVPDTSATDFDQQPETAGGRAVYEMLLRVHASVRRDLETVEGLAARAADGLDANELSEQLDELKRSSFLWRLQVDCLRYCAFVHSHHNAEDRGFFPELREVNPAIDPVIDRLQADHRRVSDDLDAVEAAARALVRDESPAVRQAVVDALAALGENLLAHLDYEEQNLESTVLRLPDSAWRRLLGA